MANDVTTRCIATGPPDQIDRFRKMIITPTLDFNNVCYIPQNLMESEESTAACNGQEILNFLYGGTSLSDRVSLEMRKFIYIPGGSYRDVAKEYLRQHPDIEQKAIHRLRCMETYGFASCYHFACENWGTHKNAYGFEMVCNDPLEFTFETAWTFPLPIFEKLSHMFLDLSFRCTCFDEGWEFAGDGYFNPPAGEKPFELCEANNELFERVYGVSVY